MRHRWRFGALAVFGTLALVPLAGPGGPVNALTPYTGPEAEGDADMFGNWSFDVTSLARTATAIGPVTNSTQACLKKGAKPAEMPLMATPLQGRCAMIRVELKRDYLSMVMQCEDFDRSTNLIMHLEPSKDGSYAGRYSFSMTLDDGGSDSMSADSTVVARRLGAC